MKIKWTNTVKIIIALICLVTVAGLYWFLLYGKSFEKVPTRGIFVMKQEYNGPVLTEQGKVK